MRKIAIAVSATMSAALIVGAADSSPLVLAERGQPAGYCIVIPQDASEINRTAAGELVLWTEKLTDVKLPVQTDAKPLPEKAILIGATRYNEQVGAASGESFPTSAFRLAARGRHVVVTAGDHDDTALVYGVCEIVQRFGGIEWFTDTVAEIPRLERLEFPSDYDVRHVPSIPIRDPGFGMFVSPAWAARFRVNGTHVGHSRSYGWSPIRWHGKFKHCHSFNAIASKAEFAKTHPEYFQKHPSGKPNLWDKHPQLCLTNPDVWALAKERFMAAVRESQDVKYFGVSQSDNVRWCRCQACRELIDREGGADSATLVPFLNMLADELAKERPDAYLTTLAYHQTRNPPKTLELRKNVLVGLCVTECDFTRPIVGNPYPGNKSFLAALERWAAVSGGVWIWDYAADFFFLPHAMPDVHALAGNIRLYADKNVFYVYECVTHGVQNPYAFFWELKAYVCAKLMWNAYQPLDPLVERFMVACYGPAAGKVREIYDLFENFERDREHSFMGYQENMCSTNFPDVLFERAAALWKEAEALAASQAPFADMVHRGRLGNDMTRVARHVCRLAEDSGFGRDDPARAAEMLAAAKEIAAVEAKRCADKEANPAAPSWDWGYTWTSRLRLKEKVEAFVEGRPIPGAPSPKKTAGEKTKLKKGGTAK